MTSMFVFFVNNVCRALHHGLKLLSFANNMRMNKHVNNLDDRLSLQIDLNRFVEYFSSL